MAKAATAGKIGPALKGGVSSFNADGSWPKAVCDAIRMVKGDSDKNTVKLTNAEKTRNALKKDLLEMAENHAEYAEKCVRFVKQLRIIEKCREDRDNYVAAYSNVIELADSNELDPEMDAKALVKRAIEMQAEEDEEDEDGHQGKLPIGTPCGPSADWKSQFEAMPGSFGDREWGIVKGHIDKLPEKAAESPLRLARWLAAGFSEVKETANRRELLKLTPAWLIDGVRSILARQAAGEISTRDGTDVTDSADMLIAFRRCAQVDVDAWLHIAGGKESALNKVVLAAEGG